MRHSESIGKLAPALVAVQSEIRAVPKDSTNPDFKSSYASLDVTIEVTRPVLTKHGLAIVQGATTPHTNEQGKVAAFSVETMLVHTSGEWLLSAVVVPLLGRRVKGGGFGEADAQAAGSAITYGRRYGLAALLSLSTDEDDDGKAASAPARSNGQQDSPPATEEQRAKMVELGKEARLSGKVAARLDLPLTQEQAGEWIAKLTSKAEQAKAATK